MLGVSDVGFNAGGLGFWSLGCRILGFSVWVSNLNFLKISWLLRLGIY